MTLSDKLKKHFTNDLMSRIIQKNSYENLYVNYYGLINDIESELLDVGLLFMGGKKSWLAIGFNLNRTTLVMKLKKLCKGMS